MSWRTDNTVFLKDILLLATSAKAYLIRTEDDAEVWIPKSQVKEIVFGRDLKDDKTGNPVKEITVLEIPTWLAEKNNLY